MVSFVNGLPTEIVNIIYAWLSTKDVGSTLITCKVPAVTREGLWRALARRLWGIEMPATTEEEDEEDSSSYYYNGDAAATVFCRVAVEKSSRDAVYAAATYKEEQEVLDHTNTKDVRIHERYDVYNLAEMRASALARVESGLAQYGSSANAGREVVQAWKSGLDFLDCLTLSGAQKTRYGSSRSHTKDTTKLSVFDISSRQTGRLTTFHHQEWIWDDPDEIDERHEEHEITAHLITNETRALIFAEINSKNTKEEEEEESRLERVTDCLCKTKGRWFPGAEQCFYPRPPTHCEELKLLKTAKTSNIRGPDATQVPRPSPSELARLFRALELDPAIVTPDDLLLAILLTFEIVTAEQFFFTEERAAPSSPLPASSTHERGGVWQVPSCLVHTEEDY